MAIRIPRALEARGSMIDARTLMAGARAEIADIAVAAAEVEHLLPGLKPRRKPGYRALQERVLGLAIETEAFFVGQAGEDPFELQEKLEAPARGKGREQGEKGAVGQG